jgi:hypothetical protein
MQRETPLAAEPAREDTPAQPVVRGRQAQGRFLRRTSMSRAVLEGVLIFAAGRLLAMVPPSVWPAALFPAVLVLRLVLSFSPPVWAALRVRSTRREKMSGRFWRLGPLMAGLCAAADALVALTLGDARLLGGAAGPPDAWRLLTSGPGHLGLGAFVLGELLTAVTLMLYFTIAVVCTRLANGGFLRFTMPAGNGRVTL